MTMTVYSKQGLLYALLNEMYAGFPDIFGWFWTTQQHFFFLSLGISDSISDLFKKMCWAWHSDPVLTGYQSSSSILDGNSSDRQQGWGSEAAT